MNKILKQTFTFSVSSILGTLFALILLGTITSVMFKGFGIENKCIWISAIYLVFIATAWTQGARASVFINFNVISAGFISTLFLNIIVLLYLKKLAFSSKLAILLFSIIFLNIIIASFGYRFGKKTDLEKNLSVSTNTILYLVTSNYLYLSVIFIFIWLIVALIVKFW